MFVPLALALLLSAKPPPDPRQDLLDAMVAEIDRNQAELKLRENHGPYFIGYQLKDYDSREVLARYGAVFQDASTHDRKISVDVRVGDYAFDSSVRAAFLDRNRGFFNGTSLLLRAHGREHEPHRLQLGRLPARWTAATAMTAVAGGGKVFEALVKEGVSRSDHPGFGMGLLHFFVCTL